MSITHAQSITVRPLRLDFAFAAVLSVISSSGCRAADRVWHCRCAAASQAPALPEVRRTTRPVPEKAQLRTLRPQEMALLKRLADFVRTGPLEVDRREELRAFLADEDRGRLRDLGRALDDGELGFIWPRVPWAGLIDMIGFQVSLAAIRTPLGGRPHPLREAFAAALERGNLRSALMVYQQAGIDYPYWVEGERRREASRSLTPSAGGRRGLSRAERVVLTRVAHGIREAAVGRLRGELIDLVGQAAERDFIGLAVALDEGVLGFKWPRSEADDLWEMLGFPVAVGGVFVHAQIVLSAGDELARVDGRRKAAEFADAVEKQEYELAYRIWKAMDLEYPPLLW